MERQVDRGTHVGKKSVEIERERDMCQLLMIMITYIELTSHSVNSNTYDGR